MRHLLTLWDSRGGPGGVRGLSRGGSLGFKQSGGVAGAAQPPWEGTAGRVTNKATGPHALGPGGARGRGAGTWSRGWGCPGRGPRKERGPCWGPGALCTLAGREPEDQHRAPPSCPPRPEGAPPGPGRSQRQAEHPLLLGSLGGPPGRRPGRGQAGGRAPGEAVARSPACGHWTVQTPFCRRLHKWGELEPSRVKCLSS